MRRSRGRSRELHQFGSELVASALELPVVVASSTVGDVEAVGLLGADDDEDDAVADGDGVQSAVAGETLSLGRI